jgi:hypothetical protein
MVSDDMITPLHPVLHHPPAKTAGSSGDDRYSWRLFTPHIITLVVILNPWEKHSWCVYIRQNPTKIANIFPVSGISVAIKKSNWGVIIYSLYNLRVFCQTAKTGSRLPLMIVTYIN